MGWLGKIFGGTIGFIMGGPLGAVAGAVFGHTLVDKEPSRALSLQNINVLSKEKQNQLTFFVAAFSMLAKIAASDREISEKEVSFINDFMEKDLQLDIAGKKAAIRIFKAAINSKDSFSDFAVQFYSSFHSQPQMLDLMLDILLKVATADGNFNKENEEMILSAVRIFSIKEDDYLKMKSKYITDVNRYLAVLGCEPEDSYGKIKSRFRELVRKYHPDAIASKGLPEEFTRFSEQKFQEIHMAHEMIKKERGIV